MTIQVNIVCNWCNTTVQGGEGTELPGDWKRKKCGDPERPGLTTEMHFCGKECGDKYDAAEPQAAEVARTEYAKVFYRTMNQLRGGA